MKPFLSQVAEHYFALGDIGKRCFVFPNRRSLVFFRKWLSECVAASGKPLVAPAMYTMNDFFYKISAKRQTDKVNLILTLYDCYKALNPSAEQLDDFLFWGDVLLGDFDDVDKYLIDAQMLFTNVSQFKDMQDTYSYLSERQREAIEQFVSNFTFNPDQGIKQRFLQIWNILYPLYSDFKTVLAESGTCYEGMAYREIADSLAGVSVTDLLSGFFDEGTSFVFVGLNALNECEKKLLKHLRDASLAEFCWDYSSEMIKDQSNRSSVFMRDNVIAFPQAFQLDPEGLEDAQIEVIGVPSSVGGAKQLPRILSGISPGKLDTAVVLPDENLLMPVLNSIPSEIADINVTMGYPMTGSEFYSLMNGIALLQMHMRQKEGEWLFYHRQVWAVFSNPVLKAVLDEEGSAVVAKVRSEAKYYIPQADFAGSPLLEAIFTPVVKDISDRSSRTVKELSAYLLDLAALLGLALKQCEGMTLELDFAKTYYQDVNRLRLKELEILPQTFIRLLGQACSGRSVPFRGEPLKGLQIMGPLETRALDFDNLIILSCNEGIFPRSNVSSSFIPPELRKGFGLPTYEYQDAVWAYYFYRMIQRSKRVWLIYDSRSEGLRSGEESRYIKQLELHFGKKFRRVTAVAPVVKPEPLPPVGKTEEDMEVLRNFVFSASSIENYLSCPVKFYYSSVKGLKEETEVEEFLDAGQFGTVLHSVMQAIYGVKGGTVSKEYLENLIKSPGKVRSLIYDKIKEQLRAPDVEGRNIIFANIIQKYVTNMLRKDCELLDREEVQAFSILTLEKKDTVEIAGRKFKGFIDRLDSLHPDSVRVVDYKTGRVVDQEIIIDDSNAEVVAEAIFTPDGKEWPKIAFQLYIYDKIVRKNYPGKRIFNSLYPAVRLFVEDIPVIECNEGFMAAVEERLAAALDSIMDPEVPFVRTANESVCEYCDFKILCGK